MAAPATLEEETRAGGTIARFLAIFGALWLASIVATPGQGVALFLGMCAALAVVGPSLGFRRYAGLFLFVPLLNMYVVVAAVWRVASLPHRYWRGSFPDYGAVGRSLMVAGALAIGGISAYAFAQDEGLGADEPAALAVRFGNQEGSPFVGEPVVAVDLQLDDTRRLVAISGQGEDGRTVISAYEFHGEEGIFGTTWSAGDVNDGTACVFLYPSYCVVRVDDAATSATLRLESGAEISARAVSRGVAVFFPIGDTSGLRFDDDLTAFDANGRELPDVPPMARGSFSHPTVSPDR